jgi:hypothetical protein
VTWKDGDSGVGYVTPVPLPSLSGIVVLYTKVLVGDQVMNIPLSSTFGYFLWNMDVHPCTHVTQFKHTIRLPRDCLFELCGWWSIGAYMCIAPAEYIITVEDIVKKEGQAVLRKVYMACQSHAKGSQGSGTEDVEVG